MVLPTVTNNNVPVFNLVWHKILNIFHTNKEARR
jgi:hypothetical protein